jgi:hypothetical protein
MPTRRSLSLQFGKPQRPNITTGPEHEGVAWTEHLSKGKQTQNAIHLLPGQHLSPFRPPSPLTTYLSVRAHLQPLNLPILQARIQILHKKSVSFPPTPHLPLNKSHLVDRHRPHTKPSTPPVRKHKRILLRKVQFALHSTQIQAQAALAARARRSG